MTLDHVLVDCHVTTEKLEGEFRVVDVARHEGNGNFMLLLINLDGYQRQS